MGEPLRMNDYNYYKDFSEDDFINDPWFQDWVAGPGVRNKVFWDQFFEHYPSQKDVAGKARRFLQAIEFPEDFPDTQLINRSLARHLGEIKKREAGKEIELKRRTRLKNSYRIAAMLGGFILLVCGLFVYINRDKSILVSTGYGEIRQVVLADSTLVILNAHSSIRYNQDRTKKAIREIWLEGEAFFNVNHINTDTNFIRKYERFIVHAGNVNIEVLGTSFDIRVRRGKTMVVLQTGKIKASFKHEASKDISMQPGDMLTIDSAGKHIAMTLTTAEKFSAWKDKKLLLDNPSAKEIIQYLEDNFGEHIILQDAKMGERKIEGAILLTNMDDALFVLSTVLNADVIRKDSSVLIRPR